MSVEDDLVAGSTMPSSEIDESNHHAEDRVPDSSSSIKSAKAGAGGVGSTNEHDLYREGQELTFHSQRVASELSDATLFLGAEQREFSVEPSVDGTGAAEVNENENDVEERATLKSLHEQLCTMGFGDSLSAAAIVQSMRDTPVRLETTQRQQAPPLLKRVFKPSFKLPIVRCKHLLRIR